MKSGERNERRHQATTTTTIDDELVVAIVRNDMQDLDSVPASQVFVRRANALSNSESVHLLLVLAQAMAV